MGTLVYINAKASTGSERFSLRLGSCSNKSTSLRHASRIIVVVAEIITCNPKSCHHWFAECRRVGCQEKLADHPKLIPVILSLVTSQANLLFIPLQKDIINLLLPHLMHV